MRKSMSTIVVSFAILVSSELVHSAEREFAAVQYGPVEDAQLVTEVAPGRVVIKLTPEAARIATPARTMASGETSAAVTGIADLDESLRAIGLTQMRRPYQPRSNPAMARQAGVDRLFILDGGVGVDAEGAVQELATSPHLESVALDRLAFPSAVPNDPMYPAQWGHNNTGQSTYYNWSMGTHEGTSPVGTLGFDSNAEIAWNRGYGDSTVVVAILDGGFDLGHPDLRLTPGYDFGNGDADPTDDAVGDWHGHGTACAGIAAATANNAIGVAGVAGECKIMPLKVVDSGGGGGPGSAVADALYWATDNGARVISMSFSFGVVNSLPLVDAALQYAYDSGVTLLAATHNYNQSEIHYPASHGLVIAVGAASPCGERKRSSSDVGELGPGTLPDANGYTCDGERWWGSNYGTDIQDDPGAVDVLAPTIIPTTDIRGLEGYSDGDYYSWFNGTSCSVPYAAGVCALIISANPGLSPAEVREVMVSKAEDVVSIESGVGWDRYTGYGMVNAAAVALYSSRAVVEGGDWLGGFYADGMMGDYDADGDLDALMIGDVDVQGSAIRVARVYANDGGTFQEVMTPLPGVMWGSVDWGDYDNDEDLDILISGMVGDSTITHVYEYNGSGSSYARAFGDSGLVGLWMSTVRWGDYDNDGDLDILLAGQPGSGDPSYVLARIYRNDGGGFSEVDAGLADLGTTAAVGETQQREVGAGVLRRTPASRVGLAWGDFDSDDDLDFAHTAMWDGVSASTEVFQNNAGTFTPVGAGITAAIDGDVSLGDADGNGSLDLVAAGYDENEYIHSLVHLNTSGAFTQVDSLYPVRRGRVAWGDADGDGDNDILLSGDTFGTPWLKVYANDGAGNCDDANAGLAFPFPGGRVDWGDYNDDGRLDILVPVSGEIQERVEGPANTPPTAPAGLQAETVGETVLLNWNGASDAETQSPTLTYNVRIGTAPGSGDVVSGMSDPITGFRRLPRMGNAGPGRSWKISSLGPGTYYWSVQAVDAGFMGGPFSDEATFTIVPGGAFEPIVEGLPGAQGDAVWADVDGDGDLDVLLASGRESFVVENQGGGEFGVTQVLPGGTLPRLACADYDLDSDIDMLMVSGSPFEGGSTVLYERRGGAFQPAPIAVPDLAWAGIDWGDLDNDGDMDIVAIGTGPDDELVADVFSNHLGDFSPSQTNLSFLELSSVHCGDYDGDGVVDILRGGNTALSVFHNLGGTFQTISPGIGEELGMAAVAWGDYSGDGRLDIAYTGTGGAGRQTRILLSLSEYSFADNFLIEGVESGDVAWGDYDNDGDLDLLIAGEGIGGGIARIYRNTGSGFEDIEAGLTGVRWAAVAWGDYDSDGRLDALVTGHASSGPLSVVYRNTRATPNTPPSAPVGLASAPVADGGWELSWGAASDAETPPASLTYNVRVGTVPGGQDVMASLTDSNDVRRVPAMGNAYHNLGYTLRDLSPNTTYYWSVQAIDTAFAGSPFGEEHSFEFYVSAVDEVPAARSQTRLLAAVPNPFNPRTAIAFELESESKAELRIFNTAGRLIKILANESRTAGRHEVIWDGRDTSGRKVGSGVYFYQLRAGDFEQTRRMVLVR